MPPTYSCPLLFREKRRGSGPAKHLVDIRRADHLVRLHVVGEREGVGLLQPEPLARRNERQRQRHAGQDVAGHREAGAGVGFQDGVRDAAAGAGEDDQDEEGVDFAGMEERCKLWEGGRGETENVGVGLLVWYLWYRVRRGHIGKCKKNGMVVGWMDGWMDGNGQSMDGDGLTSCLAPP